MLRNQITKPLLYGMLALCCVGHPAACGHPVAIHIEVDTFDDADPGPTLVAFASSNQGNYKRVDLDATGAGDVTIDVPAGDTRLSVQVVPKYTSLLGNDEDPVEIMAAKYGWAPYVQVPIPPSSTNLAVTVPLAEAVTVKGVVEVTGERPNGGEVWHSRIGEKLPRWAELAAGQYSSASGELRQQGSFECGQVVRNQAATIWCRAWFMHSAVPGQPDRPAPATFHRVELTAAQTADPVNDLGVLAIPNDGFTCLVDVDLTIWKPDYLDPAEDWTLDQWWDALGNGVCLVSTDRSVVCEVIETARIDTVATDAQGVQHGAFQIEIRSAVPPGDYDLLPIALMDAHATMTDRFIEAQYAGLPAFPGVPRVTAVAGETVALTLDTDEIEAVFEAIRAVVGTN